MRVNFFVCSSVSPKHDTIDTMCFCHKDYWLLSAIPNKFTFFYSLIKKCEWWFSILTNGCSQIPKSWLTDWLASAYNHWHWIIEKCVLYHFSWSIKTTFYQIKTILTKSSVFILQHCLDWRQMKLIAFPKNHLHWIGTCKNIVVHTIVHLSLYAMM